MRRKVVLGGTGHRGQPPERQPAAAALEAQLQGTKTHGIAEGQLFMAIVGADLQPRPEAAEQEIADHRGLLAASRPHLIEQPAALQVFRLDAGTCLARQAFPGEKLRPARGIDGRSSGNHRDRRGLEPCWRK